MAMRLYLDRMWGLIRDTVGIPNIAVEIGTRHGHWAWQLADKVGVDRLFCVDPWAVKPGFPQSPKAWMLNLKEYALKNVFPLRGTSMEWQCIFPFEIDLLFIDGCHEYQHVIDDLTHWYPKLRTKGLCLMHDANEADVARATTYFFHDRSETLRTENFGPGHKILTRWVIKSE